METVQDHRLAKLISIGMVLFAIGFNLWLYRLEPRATIDPNDNAFQYALVDRTNQVWDFADKKCTGFFLSRVSCRLSLLVDHWVPNWAEGYNLPYYYSHIPQIVIVGTYRLLSFISQFQISNFKFQINLFTYYHWVIYLLLSLFPLSVFLALRVIKLPWLIAGIGALLAGHLSTDGLYGLDPPSFLWRGYGLSSQLFGMIWMPMAIAFAWRFFSNYELGIKNYDANKTKGNKFLATSYFIIRNSSFAPAVLALVFTAMGHLGLGIMAMLSLVPLAYAPVILRLLHFPQSVTNGANEITGRVSYLHQLMQLLREQSAKLLMLASIVIFFLSYWVVPIFLTDNYHNISFWDPPWKFASYGAKETITRLLNGDLFDWGRGPWMTGLMIIGFIAALFQKSQALSSKPGFELNGADRSSRFYNYINQGQHDDYTHFPFVLLFLFWFLMYFGRTTWGPLIDLIPGMKEFHLSRFIVGVHAAGLFLIPLGIHTLIRLVVHVCTSLELRIMNYELGKIVKKISYLPVFLSYCLIVFIVLPPIYKQTIEYAKHNDRLIRQSIESHAKVKADEEALFTTLRSLPNGRIFAGRGGGFGKDFRVSETPYYMHLSTYGLPTTLWLPETWSPNSDVEQYFSEDRARDYDLFGIRYVAAPPKLEPKKFWKLIAEKPTWKLYEIELTGDAEEGTPRDPSISLRVNALALNDQQPIEGSIAREGNRGRTRQKTVGYFTTGVRVAVVATDKRSYGNVVRFWIQSDAHEQGLPAGRQGLYPELTFAKDYPRTTGLPNFKMLDEVTYVVPDGSTRNLFKEPPVYFPPGWDTNPTNPTNPTNAIMIRSETNDSDMIFSTKIDVPDNCTECMVILKQSFHPNWRATIDGKPVSTLTVFPFYLAALVPSGPPGGEASTHEVVFSYEPSRLKIALLVLELTALVSLIALTIRARFGIKS